MNETLDLIYRIQTQGIDSLDKLGASTKAITLETKYSSAELQQFSLLLSTVTRSGDTTRKGLEDLAKSAKSVGVGVAGIAKDLLELDKANQRAADEAEKSSKRQQAALQALGKAQEAAAAENKKRDEAAANPKGGGAAGTALNALGLGALAGGGYAAAIATISALKDTVVSITTSYAEASRETKNFSDRIGISVTEARRFEQIAEITGVSARSLEGGIRLVSTALEDQTGAGKRTAAALDRLGIGFTEAGGGAREMGPVMLEIVDKLSHITNASERAREATAILGRGAKELIPLFDQYAEVNAELTRLGLNVDRNIIDKGEEAEKKFATMAAAFKVLRDRLGEKIEPIVVSVIGQFVNAISDPGGGNPGLHLPNYGPGNRRPGNLNGFLTDTLTDLNTRQGSVLSRPTLANDQNDTLSLGTLVGASNETSALFAKSQAGGKTVSDAYRNSFYKTKEGIQAHIRSIESGGEDKSNNPATTGSLADLRQKLLGGGVGENAAQEIKEEINSREAQITGLNAQLKELTGAVRDAAKLERERVSTLKSAASVGRRLSGRGDTPQERLQLDTDTELRNLASSNLKGEDLARARGNVIGGSLLGKANLDREAQDKEDKKAKAAAEKEAKRLQELDLIGDEAFSMSGRLARESAKEDAAAGKDEDRYGGLGGVTTAKGRVLRAGAGKDDLAANISRQATSQDLLKQTTDDEKRQERLLEAATRPGGELATQKAISDLRLQTAAKVLEYELNIAKTKGNQAVQDQAADDAREKNAQTIKDIHAEDALKQAEAQRKNAEEARSIASGLTEAAFGGSNGVRGFFAGEGRKLASQVAGNVAGPVIQTGLDAVKGSIPTGGALGTVFSKALGGTILSPTKGKGIDGNTAALINQKDSTDKLITATDNLTGTLSGTGGSGSPGSGATGAIAPSGLASILPPGTMSAFSSISKLLNGSSTPPTGSGEAGVEGSAIPGSPDNSSGESSAEGATAKLSSAAKTLPKGAANTVTGISEIAAGAFAAYDGFKKGGAKGGVEGAAGILTTAGGIATLIPAIGPVVGGILAAAGGVVGVIGSLLGDPKQQYLHTMQKEAQQDAYQAPTSITKSMGLNGNYADVDAQGNARSSDLSAMPRIAESYYDWMKHSEVPGSVISPFGGPNTNPANGTGTGAAADAPGQGAGSQGPTYQLNINALDSKSIMDNAGILTDAMHKAITAGHPVIDEMRSQLQPGYAG